MILGMTNSPTWPRPARASARYGWGAVIEMWPATLAIDDCHSAAQDFLAHEPACKCLGVGLHVPLGRVETLGPA
jgi:hypothetical protein